MEAASLLSLSVEAREEAKEGRKRNEAYYYFDAFDGVSIRALFWCRHAGVAWPCWCVAERSKSIESVSGRKEGKGEKGNEASHDELMLRLMSMFLNDSSDTGEEYSYLSI